VRRYIFNQIGLTSQARILEAGCGYGALLEALQADDYSCLVGLDIDFPALQMIPGGVLPVCADGLALPFPVRTFDISLCHFYLMWVKEPLQALKEMSAVTKMGGWVIALAEPDYSARVDSPQALESLGKLQTRALIDQGADPSIGRHLGELFHQSGLREIQTGVISPRENLSFSQKEREMEWQVLQADLAGKVHPAELERLQAIDRHAWQAGKHRLYVPVHYTFGQV